MNGDQDKLNVKHNGLIVFVDTAQRFSKKNDSYYKSTLSREYLE